MAVLVNHWKVQASKFDGILKIPPSKSQTMRALVFALMGHGKSYIRNILSSPDVEAMLNACSSLGAHVVRRDDGVEITGIGGRIGEAEDVIQAGNSGIVARFIGAIAALSKHPIVLTGDASIRHSRPITPLIDALNQLGVQAFSLCSHGGAPFFVKGPLQQGSAVMCGEDSQPVSALLIASAFVAGCTEIFVTQPGEKPWIDLTLSWLERFKIPFKTKNYEYYQIEGPCFIEGFEYTVPADFSSLSYPVLAAIVTNSEIVVENVDFCDPQGDKKVITYLQSMGARIEIDEKGRKLKVLKGGALKGTSLDLNDCIDSLPLFAVAGCFAEGKTVLKGAAIARNKESDRISSIATELKKMGASIEEHVDGLTISQSSLKGCHVLSNHDHRIALCLAIGGFMANGTTFIEGAECSCKSYPFFCEEMQKLGGIISWH